MRYFGNKMLQFLLVLIMVFSFFQCEIVTAEEMSDKRILFISSYSPSFSTFYAQINGINETFKGYPITVDMEFMDSKRFYTTENIENFYNTISYKLSQVDKYDLLMVSDDNALDFVVTYREELFMDLPIIFFGINNKAKAIELSQDDHITGVYEAVSIKETIALALSLNEAATNVIALTDATISGQADTILFLEEQEAFPNLSFDVLDMSLMSHTSFFNELEKIDNDSVIILLSAYRDKFGYTYEFDDSLTEILNHTNQPVYHIYEHGVGDGLIGGKVISHYQQGVSAATLALRYFEGTPIATLDLVSESPNQYLIDYEVFQTFGFDPNKLPSNTVYLNKDLTIFEEYQEYVLIATLFFIIQSTIIVVMIWSLFNRHKEHQKVLDNHSKLEESYREIILKEKKIQELVYKDTLSLLSNRVSMYEYIDYYIGEPSTKNLWIVFMDIDNFKFINDTFGHDVGDQFISRIGNELSHFVSEDIEVSRFGGDEFVFSIKNQSMEEVLQIISDIQTIFHSSISINDYNVNVTVSMGLTLYPNDGQTVESLLKYADIALYEAKNKGKNQCVLFSTEMKDTLKNKLDFQHLMKEAMNLNQFYLDFQPIIDVKENRIIAYEALIRWNSDQLGQVSPIQIIKEAEETGDIIQLGNFVIEESCNFVNEINKNREEKINISINVSPVQLLSNDFVEVLESIVKRTNTERSHICLEMTESVLIENIKDSVEIINHLRELGYLIALDDFGTGYSSLSYLRNLEIDVLKVDKSFIDNITTNDYDQSIVSIVAKIAESRKLHFTAEGVESKEQLDILIALGCFTIQGYYFSKPLSKDEAIHYVENYKKGE